ncbi:MAG: PH domain-containing protein [Thermoanaerobaculia bacterium]|nr:PH domain-containing protein [Thermoanaerobaculia bacterium]
MSHDASAILAIERPHPKLMRLYWLRSLVFPPFSLIGLPFLYFRYHTMRYRFDEEGVSMRWGILFRREVSLSYGRIQDIHVTSGIFQRWLGLADLHIQTASGSSAAEMTIEGLLEFEDVRDFLYSRMRGIRKVESKAPVHAPGEATAAPSEIVSALREVSAELRATRTALERRPGGEA